MAEKIGGKGEEHNWDDEGIQDLGVNFKDVWENV